MSGDNVFRYANKLVRFQPLVGGPLVGRVTRIVGSAGGHRLHVSPNPGITYVVTPEQIIEEMEEAEHVRQA